MGVKFGIPRSELRKRYHAMALHFHPDKNFDDENAGLAFGKISVAYNNILKMLEKNDERICS